MNITRRNILLGSMALPASLLGTPIRAQGAGTVAIRHLMFAGSVQAFDIANELGYFYESGIELIPKGYATGGPESIMSLASGDIEVAVVATPALLNAIAGGNDLVGTYPTLGGGVPSKFYVLKDSPIETTKDIVGKTIAINSLGAHLDFVIREIMREADLPIGSVKLINVPNPQLEQVLRAGQADVIAVGNWVSSFQGAIEEAGGVRVIFTDADVLGTDLSHGFASMRRRFAQENPEVVVEFIRQSARAHDFTRENLEEARKIVAAILERRGENPEVARYFMGFGVRAGGMAKNNDIEFWANLMERERLLAPATLNLSNIIFGV